MQEGGQVLNLDICLRKYSEFSDAEEHLTELFWNGRVTAKKWRQQQITEVVERCGYSPNAVADF